MNDQTLFTTIFQSAEYVKNYLKKCYANKCLSSTSELAFQNSYSFIYYIKMGNSFFQQGSASPMSIQPVLFFYGLSHWLKGVLLTADPNYPATTQVLAHGISTRKRKKQSYRFLSDEIKVQKEGFFPYVSQTCFDAKQLTGEKYKMRHLLMAIPELLPMFASLEQEQPLLNAEKTDGCLKVSSVLLKRLNMSPKHYERMVKDKTGVTLKCKADDDNENKAVMSLYLEKDTADYFPLTTAMDQTHYIPAVLPLYWRLPEILAHFLLLYNLSMICRYETEWWGELLYSLSSNDRPFIESFLNCTKEKVPSLIQKLFFP
ncbi:YaaC-like Protein [Evansella caseinilytica]|uniref:YaaC-like Protein n=1 Tax=Evansella caseinilytica TaxID=1503961 RepID=A0A1H3V009_9BACI|nr:YaaC family protein [Evansella caseinilytica]SDZ67365.1 YaaC-like Protein [Evansella caseinilytica]